MRCKCCNSKEAKRTFGDYYCDDCSDVIKETIIEDRQIDPVPYILRVKLDKGYSVEDLYRMLAEEIEGSNDGDDGV